MEGGGEAGVLFQDWELLHSSDQTAPVNSSPSMADLDGIESDSDGIIRSDYFSLDSQGKYARTTTVSVGDASEEGSVVSDNPSWIDPASDTTYPRKELSEFWSDSSSDRSDDRKVNDFEVDNELGFLGKTRDQLVADEIGEIGAKSENSVNFWSGSGGIEPAQVKIGDIEKDNETGVADDATSQEVSEGLGEVRAEEGDAYSNRNGDVSVGGVENKKKEAVVWWKLPLEIVKFCVFRASPVWSLSMAAAVMGFVILGRRLYKMKKKSPSLKLKVTVDEKKVSQFTSRAARLNEAFSVVKRVPIMIRPTTLPAAGVTPWPVMSLR